MPPYSNTFNAWQQAQQLVQAQDPYLAAARGVAQAPVQYQALSPWEKIAVGFGQGLVSGGLQGYGQQNVQGNMQNLDSAVLNMMQQQSPGALPRGQLYDPIRQSFMQDQVARQANLQDKFAELQFGEQMRFQYSPEEMARQRAMQRQQTPQQMQGRQMPTVGQQVPQVSPGMAQAPAIASPLGNTLQQQEDRLAREMVMSGGMTEQAAREAAFRRLEPQRKQIDARLKTVTEEGDQGAMMENLARRGRALLESGKLDWTGPDASIWKRQALAAMGSTNAREELPAAELFERMKPEIFSMAKPPGIGAVSNFESQMFSESGPSIYATPETNRFYIDWYSERGKRLQGRRNALSELSLTRGLPIQRAEKLWDFYETKNPIFETNDSGEVRTTKAGLPIVKPARQSFEQFLQDFMPRPGESRADYKRRVGGVAPNGR